MGASDAAPRVRLYGGTVELWVIEAGVVCKALGHRRASVVESSHSLPDARKPQTNRIEWGLLREAGPT
jgi:hypothetical protein